MRKTTESLSNTSNADFLCSRVCEKEKKRKKIECRLKQGPYKDSTWDFATFSTPTSNFPTRNQLKTLFLSAEFQCDIQSQYSPDYSTFLQLTFHLI